MEPEKLITEIYGFADELINSQKEVKLQVGGYSMYPSLKPGDIIRICKTESDSLKSGDIVVFKAGNKWIAHRIIKIETVGEKKFFVTKGDSCFKTDKVLEGNDIVGKVVGYSRIQVCSIHKKEKGFVQDCKLMRYLPVILLINLWLRILLANKKIKGVCLDVFKNIAFLTLDSRRIFYINLIISIFLGIIPFVLIYLIKFLIDVLQSLKNAEFSLYEFMPILFIVGLIAFVYFLQMLLISSSGLTREKLSQSISVRVFGLIHQKHCKLEMKYLDHAEKQDEIYKAVNEAGFRPQKVVNQFLMLVQSIFALIVLSLLLIRIHWTSLFLILMAVLPLFIIRLRYVGEIYRIGKENAKEEREANYYNRILTGISFSKELRLFALKDYFVSRFNKLQELLHARKLQIIKKRIFLEIAAQIFAVLLIFVAFSSVIYMSSRGVISIGTVILFFLVFQRAFSVMKDMFTSLTNLIEDTKFLKDFHSFLAIPAEDRNQVSNDKILLKHSIVFQNVSFSYPYSNRPALENMTLEIPKGKTIALFGPNGCGKTTIIKLLCGFYNPTQGSILYDGLDISQCNQDTLRKGITAVFQDFVLYNLTAEENVMLGNVSRPFSESDIKKAAEEAGIAEVFEKLPFSYKTMLGNLFEKGEGLSIGQWQKIALARAFYRNSNILLLDEPSSALDTETEFQLMTGLKRLKQNKTVVIVGHRFSTIQWADMIYVIDKGRVIEKGTHDDLLRMKGRYYELFTLANP